MTETINLDRDSGLVALKSWFKAGCPGKVPVSDRPEDLILRGYVYLLGLANHGVDLRRSRRLLVQSGEAGGCEILMNVASTACLSGKAPEMEPSAAAWIKQAIDKGSLKAYAVRALFALSPRRNEGTPTLDNLGKETEGDAGATAAIARTLHILRHPEAEAWVRRAELLGVSLPFERSFYEKLAGQDDGETLLKGAASGDVACCRQLLQEDIPLSDKERRTFAHTGALQVDPSCAYYHALELLKEGDSPDIRHLLLTTLMAPEVPEADSAVEMLQKIEPSWFDAQGQLRAPRGEFLSWLYRQLSKVTYDPSLSLFVNQWLRMVFHPRAPKLD